jgi:hypothetical protein
MRKKKKTMRKKKRRWSKGDNIGVIFEAWVRELMPQWFVNNKKRSRCADG